MANITFYIDKTNSDREGFSPIKANVTIDYKNVTKTVGRIKSKHWNKNKQRVSPPRQNEEDNGHIEINIHLDKLKTDATNYFRDCTFQNVPITLSFLKDFFKGIVLKFTPPDKKDLWDAYEEFLKSGEIERAVNTNKNRKTIKNYLKNFETETGYLMTFESIDMIFFDQLKEYVLVTKSNGYNYLSSINDKFKAFMSWSLERDYHSNTIYKKFSAPEKEGSIIHLTIQELQQLINFPFENNKLQKARDFYCFGCMTGLRYCDLQRLTKDNIADGMIKMTTQKTNRDVMIPLFPGIRTIIDRYPEPHKLLPKFSNQKLNVYIKECCKKAGINTPTEYKSFEKNVTRTEFKPKHELIGTHTARKTFICLAYDRGIDIEMIKSITGITREKTLRRYLHVSNDTKKEKLTKAFENL